MKRLLTYLRRLSRPSGTIVTQWLRAEQYTLRSGWQDDRLIYAWYDDSGTQVSRLYGSQEMASVHFGEFEEDRDPFEWMLKREEATR